VSAGKVSASTTLLSQLLTRWLDALGVDSDESGCGSVTAKNPAARDLAATDPRHTRVAQGGSRRSSGRGVVIILLFLWPGSLRDLAGA
jgi:hypothetical protein